MKNLLILLTCTACSCALGQDPWKRHTIDNSSILDLTGNGLPDLLTCEEVTNLGVFWYENLAKPRP